MRTILVCAILMGVLYGMVARSLYPVVSRHMGQITNALRAR